MLRKLILGLGLVAAVILATGLRSKEDSTASAGASDQFQRLNQAIKDLQHPNKIMRRPAAETISSLISTPGIQRAINPLANVLLNQGKPSGMFTQMIAAETLGRIAAQVGAPTGDEAVDALIECLETEGLDTVRSACAQGLGLALNELSVEPLQLSLQSDGSPLVKYEAQAALKQLALAGVGLSSDPKNLTMDSLAQPPAEEYEIYQYLKARTLYAHPSLDAERGQR
jgi:HEAT repeat protein